MAVADPSALRAARAVEHPRLLANPAIAGEFFAFHTTEQLPGRDGMPIGALHVMDHRTHAFTDRDHEVLRYLAGLTAEQVSAGRLIRRLSRADVALRTVSADVAARTGDEFFRALVAQLTRTLNVDYAFVAELAEGKNERAQVIAFSADGTVIEGAEYDLRGTPCRDVIRGEVCSVSLGVRQVYPEDRLLTELGVESYGGMTLCCGEGGCFSPKRPRKCCWSSAAKVWPRACPAISRAGSRRRTISRF